MRRTLILFLVVWAGLAWLVCSARGQDPQSDSRPAYLKVYLPASAHLLVDGTSTRQSLRTLGCAERYRRRMHSLMVRSWAMLISRPTTAGMPSCSSLAAPRAPPSDPSTRTMASASSPASGVCQIRAVRCHT